MDLHREKVKGLIMEKTADFFNRESNRMSLITVTDCLISKDGRRATVYISVLPDSQKESALNFAKRKRKDLKDYVMKNTKIGRIPHFEVELI